MLSGFTPSHLTLVSKKTSGPLAVVGRAASFTAGTSNFTTITITIPGPATVGTLLIAVCWRRQGGGGTWTFPAGWTQFGNTTDSFAAAWRVSDGTETTVIPTANAGGRLSAACVRISGAADPVLTPPEAASANAGSGQANPPSKASTWGAAQTLVIAAGGMESNTDFTAAPAGYSNLNSGFGNGHECATAEKIMAGATEDPAAFANASSTVWGAKTIFVKAA